MTDSRSVIFRREPVSDRSMSGTPAAKASDRPKENAATRALSPSARDDRPPPESPPTTMMSATSITTRPLRGHEAPSQEESSPVRVTRKRTASSTAPDTPGASSDDYAEQNAPPNSGSTTNQPSTELALSSARGVCLCPPEPKVPRPRNAFMLYRQHHQANVVVQNPGLANPDISKIIGKQWKAEQQEVKDNWDALAQEEKQRHHQQYPNYKYQPKRKGKKPSSISYSEPGSAGSDDICSRCGRRTLATPGTPSTPFHFGPKLPLLPPLNSSTSSSPRSLPSLNMAMTAPLGHRRRSGLSLQYPGLAEFDDDNSPGTPDGKRRRFNVSNSPHPVGPTPLQYHQARLASTEHSQAPQHQLPQPENLVAGQMGPPPSRRPASLNPHQDLSLKLPPLQTSPPEQQQQQHQQQQQQGPQHQQDHQQQYQQQHQQQQQQNSQYRSVEAMVMTIPYMSKIRVLSRISPPLKVPGPTSPAQQVRGAIVAIDGEDDAAIVEVTRMLYDVLGREKENELLVVEPPAAVVEHDRLLDSQHQQLLTQKRGDADQAADGGFVWWIESIAAWHEKSKLIKEFVTTAPSWPSSPPTLNAALSVGRPNHASFPSPPANLDRQPPLSRSPASLSPPISARLQQHQMLPPSHSVPQRQQMFHEHAQQSRTPIALIPSYMLTRSNRAASLIPINDAYAPVDHWQWVATLWRGVIGADLTLWIKDCDAEEIGRGIGPGVEVKEDVRAVIVRKIKGEAMDARTLRRLGFEVGEIVRGISSQGIGRVESREVVMMD